MDELDEHTRIVAEAVMAFRTAHKRFTELAENESGQFKAQLDDILGHLDQAVDAMEAIGQAIEPETRGHEIRVDFEPRDGESQLRPLDRLGKAGWGFRECHLRLERLSGNDTLVHSAAIKRAHEACAPAFPLVGSLLEDAEKLSEGE